MDEETIVVELDGKYAGWRAVMRADPLWGFFEDMSSGNVERIGRAVVSELIEWNFKDREGKTAQATASGLRQVPQRAVQLLISRYIALFTSLPNPSDTA